MTVGCVCDREFQVLVAFAALAGAVFGYLLHTVVRFIDWRGVKEVFNGTAKGD